MIEMMIANSSKINKQVGKQQEVEIVMGRE